MAQADHRSTPAVETSTSSTTPTWYLEIAKSSKALDELAKSIAQWLVCSVVWGFSDLAWDVAVDTLLVAGKAPANFPSRASLFGYARVRYVHRVIKVRKRASLAAAYLASLDEDVGVDCSVFEEKLRHGAVYQAIQRLREPYRSILEARLAGLSAAEVADITGKAIPTVRNYTRGAILMLRSLMGKERKK